MVIRAPRFNIYLLLTAALTFVVGCQTTAKKEEKQLATLRIHLETNPQLGDQSEIVSIFRSAPTLICVEKYPFLHESDITTARVVDDAGGFMLALQFDQKGQRILEQYSSGNSRRRLVIRTQFRMSTNVYDRWIAAPLITRRIADGLLTFTPDASREEADAMVLGWNNVVSDNQAKSLLPADEKKKPAPTK